MMRNNMINGRKQNVLMFPWLGHGHVSPFLELAKKHINTNLFNVYLCSTCANLCLVKQAQVNESITFIELNLEPLPDLPSELNTTNGLPLHLMPSLKNAFDLGKPWFSQILEMLKPDLLIYDMIQHWALMVASALGIPSVLFITTSATMAANMFHLYLKQDVAFPFDSIYYRKYEKKNVKEILESSANGCKDKDRVMQGVKWSKNIMLVKSFKEIEGKYGDYLSSLTSKRVVPVGPLVVDSIDVDSEQNTDMTQIALGLEISNVNFIWVLRFPKGENSMTIKEALPGFVKRVKTRGLLVEGWAPQAKILRHKNIGQFVSHCGWSSVMEARKFGVPIIAMLMNLDQPVNARLVAQVVNEVVASNLGKNIRDKAKKISDDLETKCDEEIKFVMDEILQLCQKGHKLRRVGAPLQKAKSDGFMIHS
ncbi:beta-D-glucosyl crocetin beta-1,6-glucosyltransferase-like protein [Tanacetum coccineum]